MGSLLSVLNGRRKTRLHVLLLVLMLSLAVWGCGSDGEGGGEGAEGAGEGAGEGVGEEGGAALAFGDMFDQVRKGARLILEGPGFAGTVENTTTDPLQNVRVEVHLSNGVELGPEVIGDMAPGEMADVVVFLTDEAVATPFDGWTPHAEVGAGMGAGAEGGGEHGPGGEGGTEGGGEGAGEGGGEEGGAALALGDMFNQVRKGARLIIEGPAFAGTVENTTTGTLQNVRVEVHLSNGVELGPEMIGDMAPGEMVDVAVFLTDEALATPFDGWTPHAEVGAGGDSGGEGGSGS